MCGRFFLRPSLDEILRIFDAAVDDVDAIVSPRWNIAPTQQILVITEDPLAGRRLSWMRWGLVPSWWKQPRLPTFINARAETVATKPTFRSAFKRRRCLIPASGFYEWTGDKKDRQAWAITGDAVMAFAGVHEVYRGGEGTLRSAAILTNASRGGFASLHDRSPVALPREQWATWLSPKTDAQTVQPWLDPQDHGWSAQAVGRSVGPVKNSSGDWFDAV